MPVLLPIAIGIAAAGTVMNVVGNIKAGNAADRAAEYDAGQLELQALDAEGRGEEDASRMRSRVRGLIGGQRAAFAGQGVDLAQADGSAREVQADTATLGELDTQQILANARREAWGMRSDAVSVRMGGRAAKSASRWGAAAAGVGGAGSLLMTTYGWQRTAPAPRG